jgi:hypothetical protein
VRLGCGRSVLVVSVAVGLLVLAGCGGDDDSSESSVSASTAAAVHAPPEAVATSTAPLPGPPALPAQIPRFALMAATFGTPRESLVFQTRTAILNGLSGQASDYAVEIAEAAGGGETGLLIGVVARPGTSPPNIPDDVNALIEVTPEATYRVHGNDVQLHQVPGYHLAVVDGGPGHAVVAIGVNLPLTRKIAAAVAQAVAAS